MRKDSMQWLYSKQHDQISHRLCHTSILSFAAAILKKSKLVRLEKRAI